MNNLLLNSPMKGEMIDLAKVPDTAFASGSLGLGVGIIPADNNVYAPCDGIVEVLFTTKHAIGIKTLGGANLLIHVGLNTVKLDGKYFTAKVSQGSTVKAGDLLLTFDAEKIKEAGYDTITPVVITNPEVFDEIIIRDSQGQMHPVKAADAKETVAELAQTMEAKIADETNEKYVAEEIIKAVGGIENINAAEHCATRLRLIIKDKSMLDEKVVEHIAGVKGQCFAAGQYQIILGTGFVNKVYGEVQNIINRKNEATDAYAKMTITQKISRTLGDIFIPIIPVLVATGLFMGIRGALVTLGVELSEQFLLMSKILTDTAFAFLPALVTWSVMKRFGGTPVIGIVLGLMLVAPQLPNAYAIAGGEAVPFQFNLLGLNIPVVGYQGTVLPAICLGIFAAKFEKFLKKYIPDTIDLIVTPFVVLFTSMLLGLLLLGPILHTIETNIFTMVRSFLELPFGIGGIIVGGFHQLIVVSGVHHVFNALEIELLASTGRDMFNAIITGAVIAQGAAGLAVALKAPTKKQRAMYISSVIPAFLGITEPVIFGINLRFVKPFICALIGGACAGGLAAFLKLAGTGMGITVLPGTLLYMDRLFEFFIVNLVGFVVAFTLTMLTYKHSSQN